VKFRSSQRNGYSCIWSSHRAKDSHVLQHAPAQRADGFSLIGVSCLEVGVLDPSNPKRERSLAKLNEIIDGTIDIIELAKRNQ